MNDEFMKELEKYRNVGLIYFQYYVFVKKMKNFNWKVPDIPNTELDDMSEAIMYTMDYINEHGFDTLPNISTGKVGLHKEVFGLDKPDPAPIVDDDDDDIDTDGIIEDDCVIHLSE